MIRKLLLTALVYFSAISLYAQYVSDVLGDDYLHRTFQMPDDYEGKVVCTLVKKQQLTDVKQAILYIHGYNDYFFQKQLGDSVNAHGYNFYAMDLRKYGRSIRPNHTPFFCKSLTEYFADIDTALATIRSEGNDKVLLMAHSTGGLIAPLYVESKKDNRPVNGLILNSPFLDWNFGWFMEKVTIPVIAFVGRFFPDLTVQGYGIASYTHSLLKQFKGEWEYDTNWKMPNGYPKKAGWIKAIQEGQQKVKKGLQLELPTLVMSSDKSYPETEEWHNEYLSADIILNVDDIQKYAPNLGYLAVSDTITNGMHDLFLSEKRSRDQAYRAIFEWIKWWQ